MVTLERWKHAQNYERGFWQRQAEQIAAGTLSQLEWYGWRAEQLAQKLNRLGLDRLTDGSARVLEVGCGPIGVASYFPARTRIAVDPLENFYAGNPVLSALRNPLVSYRQGVGESLPCEDGEFDLAIIENCIDHVQDVHAVMGELRRVLHRTGVLYLTVNSRTRWGFLAHRVLSRLRVDPGHPHTFTPARVRSMLSSSSFGLLSIQTASYWDALREDLTSSELRAKAKALLGTSEFVVSAFARKSLSAAA